MGQLQTRTWQDQNGQNRKVFFVLIDKCELLGERKAEQAPTAPTTPPTVPVQPPIASTAPTAPTQTDFFEQVDGLPFQI